MTGEISKVAVIGGGTMGSGIAAAAALAGCDVVVFEVNADLAAKAAARVASLAADDAERGLLAARVAVAALDADAPRLGDRDWICEAAIEDLSAKREILAKVAAHRRPDALVSTNTSGIPLRAIAETLPEDLGRDLMVSHFFNPVRVMKLVELVAGPNTPAEKRDRLAAFLGGRLGKGVVAAKDTPNFIGNRIGCFFILAGLAHGAAHRGAGLGIDALDALLGAPIGLPPTGLYGLADLIGLDVMAAIGRNLAATLPEDDVGRAYAVLPAAETAMIGRGQLGRKSGGGYYRIRRDPDGTKTKEVYSPEAGSWSPVRPAVADPRPLSERFFAEDEAGGVLRDTLGATLAYAADLIPDIADDVVAVDRALRWGFNWAKGPFELIDAIGPAAFAAWCLETGKRMPKMLAILTAARADRFYEGTEVLCCDGRRRPFDAA